MKNHVGNLTGSRIGEWEILGHSDKKSYWKCMCSCGNIKDVSQYSLIHGKSKSCGHSTNSFKDLTGKKFNNWEVIEFIGNQYWGCRCSCGKIKNVHSYSLTSGASTSCGHSTNEFRDETGNIFGDWSVLKYLGNQRYLCRCSCGIEKSVGVRELRNGESRSCGHNKYDHIDLNNTQFGYLQIIEYLDRSLCKCRCICGNEVVVQLNSLISGNTRSCGCKSLELSNETKLMRYGEVAVNKISNPRQLWQIRAFENLDNFKDFLESLTIKLGRKPYIREVVELLGVNKSTVIQKAKAFGLENKFGNGLVRSKGEEELYQYIISIYNGKVIPNDRNIIKPKELDIYIPDLKLAIEYNGVYWHDNLEENNPGYHAEKKKLCEKSGIELINVWDTDWNNDSNSIKLMIKDIILSAVFKT